MKIERVAAQLYTVRDFIKTPPEIAASMKRVRKIGYQAVQVSGMGPIAEEELLRILDGEGLTCCATHEPGERILKEPQRVVDTLRKLKCRHTAYPYPGGIKFDTLASVKEFAAKLNASGKVLHDAGLVLSYHNHADRVPAPGRANPPRDHLRRNRPAVSQRSNPTRTGCSTAEAVRWSGARN